MKGMEECPSISITRIVVSRGLAQGTWSQFMRNRTKAIQQKEYLQWHHVPTSDNPSDEGSRGVGPSKVRELWIQGPNWLSDQCKYPQQPEVAESVETTQREYRLGLRSTYLPRDKESRVEP